MTRQEQLFNKLLENYAMFVASGHNMTFTVWFQEAEKCDFYKRDIKEFKYLIGMGE